MNCYLCFVETGSACHPALAICQRCGAAICETHLIRLGGPPMAGLAGTHRPLLICSSCSETTQMKKSPEQRKPIGYERKRGSVLRRHPWHWLLRRRSPGLPEPAEAVKAAEQFLSRQQK
jgi:hypothetical protein